MAITIHRILIDTAGSTRVFYSRDNGPAGTAVFEFGDTVELKAIVDLLQKAVSDKITAGSTPKGREAARAARVE